MSDIHCNFDRFRPADLPDADICVIAGDITNNGRSQRKGAVQELYAASRWLQEMAARYPWVYGISGNHDIGIGPWFFNKAGVLGIMDEHVEYGGLRFYGVSITTAYAMPELATVWDYMTARRDVEEAAFDMPPGIDVIVSHGPPFGIRDDCGAIIGQKEHEHIGSRCLLEYIDREKPKAVICGHVHGSHNVGQTVRVHPDGTVTNIYNVAETWRLIDV